MKKCKKDCKSCTMVSFKTSSNNDSHIIPFCLECTKFGILGDSFTELYENVLWENA